MKQGCVVLTLLSILPAIPALSCGSWNGEDVKAEINAACGILMDPESSPTQARIVDSLSRLLDVAAALAPDNEYREDIAYRIDTAKELFHNDSLFNEKARQYLSFAYRQMTGGTKYVKPAELDEFVTPQEGMEKARLYAIRLKDRALEELDAGSPGETAKLLLELVLMVITPVEG